ncbi:hypothetical protein [Pseudactinotalea terrae]|uniref:hypothetical protein n=1 Tax=Pseudactinotalea terrae TaxID=1743262 RepID=UPI0012E245CD|nr:hypothetical protein [Pseudactinotalea terrae]
MTEKSVEELQREVLGLQVDTYELQLRQLEAESPPKQDKQDPAAAKEAAEAAARAKKQAATAAALTGVATELGKITGGTLTLPAEVFRQRELSSAALVAAAARVAATIDGVAKPPEAAEAKPVLVTGRTDQTQSVLAARSLLAAVTSLQDAAAELIAEDHDEVTPAEAKETGSAPPSDPIAAAAALAVAALNLLSVETTVTAASGTATELETHVPVIQQLLVKKVPVLHSSLGIPAPGNRVIDAFASLAPVIAQLDAIAAAAAHAIAALGKDPPAEELEPYLLRQTRAEALSATMVELTATVREIDPATGTSPLHSAATADQLLLGPDAAAAYVAIVMPARIDAHQVSLKRRLGASRLVVSASATIDVVVLDMATGLIVAAATHTEARAFQVRFPMWFRWWGTEEDHPSNPRYTPVTAPSLA